MKEKKRGDTQKQFLQYLQQHGPQTTKQLLGQPFFGGVRSRIGTLIKQGRIERVHVATPGNNPYRAVSVAFKYVQDASMEPLSLGGRKPGTESRPERVRRERIDRATMKAIELLKSHGYTVTAP